MKKNVNLENFVKKLLTPVKVTKENAAKYRLDGDPRDYDDAFIESLTEAAEKIKKKNLPKDSFEKFEE